MKTPFLFVVTGHTELGDTGKQTGFHFEELSTPYYILRDAGHEVVFASPAGGEVKPDPGSLKPRGENVPSVERFLDDAQAMDALKNTQPTKAVKADDVSGIYLPGGHGTMWDLPQDAALAKLIGALDEARKPVAAVCHGPAGLVAAKRSDGEPLVKGRRVNSFTDAEERKVELTDVVPFLLETRLRELGAEFEHAGLFEAHVTRDGNLITGQNPASAKRLGEAIRGALASAAAQQAAE
ncbi:type 1 glutamine amidotransferase domain-containing protein [Oceanibaculum pacificum]|uniref:Glutamine amidotransferase n=1 Tax=Oceanibaculum pacificum TaxID=580166 RepID=A0A154WF67_9PROT|nr:type 1 glutamine amidotransferase domain-containing protein [Oceanibaculum pacificum]KZD12139.1 glutamine amidotransferase [Oceanibaculum pacificum]